MRRVSWVSLVLLSAGCFEDPDDAVGNDDGTSTTQSSSAESSSGAASTGVAESTGGCDGEVDACGVCNGPGGPCAGCTNPDASNYDALATVDDDSCKCVAANGGEPDQAVDVLTSSAGSAQQWQSFVAGVGGGLTRVDLGVSSPLAPDASPGTIRIYAGEGTAGTELHSQSVTFEATTADFQQFMLEPPLALVQGETYTIYFEVPEIMIGWVSQNNDDVYPQGRSSSSDETIDLLFRTSMAPCLAG